MNFNRHLSILVVLLTFTLVTHRLDAQDFSAGINTETPNPNAVLHLVSPNGDQGLLIPKLTILQRTNLGTALGTADEGIMVYDEEEQRFYFWDGTRWVFINSGISGAISAVTSDATLTGDGAATILSVNTGTLPNQIVQLDGTGNLPAVDGSALTGVTADGFSGNLAGDVTGTQNATVVNSVGGQTAVNVATATGIVNGAPALDVDATDDFDQNSTPLGAFTGTTITDNTALTNALQELETAVEGFTAVNVDGTTITGDGNATPLAVGTLAAAQVTGLSAVATTGNFGDLLTIPVGLADGDDIGLATVNVDGTTITGDGDVTALAVGNVPAASVTGLSAVATTGSFGDLITIPAGLADGDDVGLTAVTSADIIDDEIVNLDINAGADIAATKLQATVMVEGENVSLLNNDAGYLTAIAELDPVWTADRTTLGTAGTINDPGNLIEWTRLKGIPVGFSDGIDDGLTVVTSADITNNEIVDADINAGAAIAWTKVDKTGANVSELANDAGYLTAFTELDPVWTGDRTTLGTVGTINDPGNLIEWTRLKGIPVGFSDGIDDGLTAVTSADITNNEIVDADINAAAAIAWTKINKTGANVSELANDAGYLTAFTELDPVWTGDRTTLGTVGTINDPGNLIEWTRLKGIPAGFSDGIDDGLTAVTSADITNNEILDVDINAAAAISATKLQATVMVEGENVSLLNNDAGYLTSFTELDPIWTADRTTLAATGTINDPGNLIDWTRLKSVPAVFADGTDDGLWTDNTPNISYTAGFVGIGITTPRRELHLDGPAGGISFQMTNSASGSATNADGFVIDYNDGPTQEIDFIHNEGFNMRFGEPGSTYLTVDNQNDRVLTGALEANVNAASDGFRSLQTGGGRSAFVSVNNTTNLSPALEVSSNGAAGSYLARFDRNVGSTGGGIFIDMNNVNAALEPAIQISSTNIPFQIFSGSFDGATLISDGSGNMTFADGLSINRAGRFNIASTTLSGTGSGLADPSTGQFNILLGRTAGGALSDGSSNIMIGDIVSPGATTGDNNVIMGATAATGLTIGSNNISIGTGSGGAVLTTGSGNIFLGNTATLGGADGASSNNVAVGTTANATGGNATALGNGSTVSAINASALGNQASASAVRSIAIGSLSVSDGTDGIAIGTAANNTGASNAVAIGNGATNLADEAVAIGLSTSTAIASVAIGPTAQAIGTNSVAIGSGATANAAGAVAIGNGSLATSPNAVTVGNTGGPTYDLIVTGRSIHRGDVVLFGNSTIQANVASIPHTAPAVALSLPAHILEISSSGLIGDWYDNGAANGTICKVINLSGGPITYDDSNNISPVGGTFVQAPNQVITMVFLSAAGVWFIED